MQSPSLHLSITLTSVLLVSGQLAAQEDREDLDRLAGLYGEPASNRQLFVMPSCDGQLVIGPMWADVGPWWMTQVSEMEFTYADSFTQFAVEFKLNDQKEIEMLEHDINGVSSPMKRAGPVPPEFGECVPPPLR